MNLNDANNIANQIVRNLMLSERGWKVSWNRRKTSAGLCRYRTRELQFSIPVSQMATEEEFRETVLHECAHALAGHAAGHGPEWSRMLVSIGGTNTNARIDGERAREIVQATAKWQATCTTTGKVVMRSNRLTARQRTMICTCHRSPIQWRPNS